jgi:hypothetical protein
MFYTKVVEKTKPHVIFNNDFFKNRDVYDVMWKNRVQLVKAQISIWRMRIAY